MLSEDEIEKNKNDIDFIEVHNGRNVSEKYDEKQNEIAEKYKLVKIIGSDAHTFFELGRNYVLTENKITINNLKQEYKNVKFKEKRCINFAHKWTKIAKIISLICGGDFNGIIRVIKRKFKREK